MSDKPFPIDLIQPTGGRFDGEPNDYSITITLAPFELDGESYETKIILEGIEIANGSITALANKSLDFPTNPQDGYIDGSVYLCNVHNPVDVTWLKFGTPKGKTLPVELNMRFVFEFEGTGYTNVECRLSVDIEHTVM